MISSCQGLIHRKKSPASQADALSRGIAWWQRHDLRRPNPWIVYLRVFLRVNQDWQSAILPQNDPFVKEFRVVSRGTGRGGMGPDPSQKNALFPDLPPRLIATEAAIRARSGSEWTTRIRHSDRPHVSACRGYNPKDSVTPGHPHSRGSLVICNRSHRWIRPAVLPRARASTSAAVTGLKSPGMVCFKHEAATPKARASAALRPVTRP